MLPTATSLPPPAAFQREVRRTIAALGIFIVGYIVVVILTLALVAVIFYGAAVLLLGPPDVGIIVIGVGMIGVDIMLLLYIFKFLFETSAEDLSDSVEITVEEQPELVAVIQRIAQQTGTVQPKKIYLSHDVNASVFYNSSFWSLFLPVQKNLKIGLGLMNAVNVSELKAIIAHEFGHFSQRSMRLSSFVYYANRIIYNMLYENKEYAKTLAGFARMNLLFNLLARFTFGVVNGIQWLLQRMFQVVNLNYFALSRQMEFHADHVSASLFGTNNIISSLHRVEFADVCLQQALSVYEGVWKDNKKPGNIYPDHRTVIVDVAQKNGYELKEGLPMMDKPFQYDEQKRINIEEQWASHPSTPDRKAFLDGFKLDGMVEDLSAWTLINKPIKWQELITGKLYEKVKGNEERLPIDNARFVVLFENQMQPFSLPSVFEGYYDRRFINDFDIEEALRAAKMPTSFVSVFTGPVKNLPRNIRSLEADIALLKNLEKKEITVDSFDFDGVKHKAANASCIREQLEEELGKQRQALCDSDKRLFVFFYQQFLDTAADDKDLYVEAYTSFLRQQKEADEYRVQHQRVLNLWLRLYVRPTLEPEAVLSIIADYEQDEEGILKFKLKKWLERGAFENQHDIEAAIVHFIAADPQYFFEGHYFENELEELNMVVDETYESIGKFMFAQFKKILETKASWLLTNYRTPI